MAQNNKDERSPRRARYEFRVWGKHRKARKKLAELATSTSHETFEDCYLIVDDLDWNAKVRDNTLKIKQLVSEDKGFEQWSRDHYVTSEDTPTPFDEVFDALKLRPVFVTKERQRFDIGDLIAEVTDISFADSDEVLHTLSVEGDDLKALVKLRKELGLRDEPNVAMHQAIDQVD